MPQKVVVDTGIISITPNKRNMAIMSIYTKLPDFKIIIKKYYYQQLNLKYS